MIAPDLCGFLNIPEHREGYKSILETREETDFSYRIDLQGAFHGLNR
jgi:hypothetical protein